MMNVQVIDGAQNCTFPVFQVTEEEFKKIFPLPGQNIEFIEDLNSRLDQIELSRVLSAMWERPVLKSQVHGLHGTLFYEFESKREYFPASKCEKDFNPSYINEAQRRMYRSEQEKDQSR